jgi:hypothetical protein
MIKRAAPKRAAPTKALLLLIERKCQLCIIQVSKPEGQCDCFENVMLLIVLLLDQNIFCLLERFIVFSLPYLIIALLILSLLMLFLLLFTMHFLVSPMSLYDPPEKRLSEFFGERECKRI